MNPRFHLALSRWKPGFTWLAAGLTFMIKVSDVTPGARDHRVRDPAALDVSRPQLKRRIDLPVGQELRIAIPAGQQSHAPENTRRGSAGTWYAGS